MKRTAALLIGCAFISGCGRYAAIQDMPDSGTAPEVLEIERFGAFDSEDTFANECSILLGDSITVRGGGALVGENGISITQGGVYTISGSLDGGMIFVESEAPVKLILSGAEIRSEGAAVSSANGKLIIECAEGTENFLYGGDGSGAALYGGDKLVICGGGFLTVDGGSGVGIEAKGKLKLVCGNVTVNNAAEIYRAESIDTAEGVFIATDR